MLPSSDAGAGSEGPGRSGLKRWGPLVAIVAVVVVVGGALLLTSGGGDDEADPTSTTVAPGSFTSADLPEGVLPFDVAEAEGIDVDWPDTCDTERGTVAYPSFFAPTCYAPFEGDNGGATDQGVTGDSIKIVWYLGPDEDPIIDFITEGISDDTAADTRATVEGFNEFFGHFAETYGREVDLEFYEATGTADDEIAARADAVAIAEDQQPFMVMNGPALTSAFAEELAARGVSCIQCGPTQPQGFYEEADPYLLMINMSSEQGQFHTAAFLGRQLAGKPAAFAGDDLADEERVFGLVYLNSVENAEEGVQQLEDRLAEEGVDLAESVGYDSPITLQTTAPNVIAKLKDAGVTTVLFAGDPVAPRELTREATAQDWFPEWVVTPSSILVDTNVFSRTYDQDQWAHAFGVSTSAVHVDPSNQGSAFLYQWYFGEAPLADDTVALLSAQLNTFYNVVQGVGPDLTRQAFRDTIFAAEPTPSAVTQPSLSWGDKGIWPETDWLGIDDATLIWWDPEAEGPDENGDVARGMWQFVDGGTRYLPDEWPEDDPKLFDERGAVAIYEEPPADEAPPDYPSPAG